MKYAVGDLVYFEDYSQKGVGKVVAIDNKDDYQPYLVHSTQITVGHNGNHRVVKEDNKNNWWFEEEELKPFSKKVGQKYKLLEDYRSFKKGEIVTLIGIEKDNISHYKGTECWYLLDLDIKYCGIEFYEDTPSAKENEMFTKEDLKPGYLVKIRDGSIAHVVDTKQRGLCLNFEDGFEELSSYNNDLIFGSKGLEDLDIVEVYDFTEDGYNAHKFEVGDRKLLWKREENPKKYYLKHHSAFDGCLLMRAYINKKRDTKTLILDTKGESSINQTQFTQEEIDHFVKEHRLKLEFLEQIEVEECED